MNSQYLVCSCGGKMWREGGGMMTCVGYMSPQGHDHDDNCLTYAVRCETCNKIEPISVQRTCTTPGCNWKGKETCFCHKGKKLTFTPSEKPI